MTTESKTDYTPHVYARKYYEIDEVRKIMLLLLNFRCPTAARFVVERFYQRPALDESLDHIAGHEHIVQGDAFVAEQLTKFEWNPCSWALTLTDKELSKLVDVL